MVEIDNETAQFFRRAHRYPIPKLAQETESPMLEPTWVPTGLALAKPFPSDRLTKEDNDTAGPRGGDGTSSRPPRKGPNNTKGRTRPTRPGTPRTLVKPKGPQTLSTYKVVSLYQVLHQNKVTTSAENVVWRQWPTAGWPACGNRTLYSQNFEN